MPFERYGINWKDRTPDIFIELDMIRRLYFVKDKANLLEHYFRAHRLLWPEDIQHRWFKLGMKAIVENKISIFLGCANSGKTYLMSSHALIDFFCFPHTSLSLISSTDVRSLELRIWGRGVKNLFNRARAKFPFLPGVILDSKMAIVPNEIDEEGQFAREISMGLVCVPCVSGGRFVGMSKFQGVKPPNSPGKDDGILKSYNDELAVMQPSILDGFSNWTSNDNFKGIGAANPTDISDPACTASEPIGGWDSFVDNGSTQTWRSRWHDSFVVAFDGRDTPNNDEPRNQYKFLAKAEFVEGLKTTYGEDSWQLYQQGIGKPSRGMVSNRVLTVGFCEQHKAFEAPVWIASPTIKLAACDPAFGGGDRCVWITGRIGQGADGRQILEIDEPEIIPIQLRPGFESEQQIAAFIKNKCTQLSIPPENVSYDSFGRAGTLGFFFNEVFKGGTAPVPVDSGGRPTDRPVRFDLFVEENGQRRLKRCDEAYSKRVTEFWFSVREAIHSEQIRSFPKSVAAEFQMRVFKVVTGNRVEIEPKEDMKERLKKSPDFADAASFLVEGARRLGFQIDRIGKATVESLNEDFFQKEADDWNNAIKSGLLKR